MGNSLYNFDSNGRLPVVPLSYEFKEFAKTRELIVDYTAGDVYVKTDSGEIINISASKTMIDNFVQYLKNNPDIVGDLIIKTPNGNTDNIENVLDMFYARITELNNKKYLYAGSDTDGGSANSAEKLVNSLTINEDNGTSTFDGSKNVSVDLTKYYSKTGGEISGDVILGNILVLAENVMYGETLPTKGTEGQLFFLLEE